MLCWKEKGMALALAMAVLPFIFPLSIPMLASYSVNGDGWRWQNPVP